MPTIQSLEPRTIWEIFYDLTTIPRPSGHETAVIGHLKSFATDHGLESEIDDVGNLIIRKPASPGKENVKPVVLQAHVDMVPQKNNGTDHNFLTDPIQTEIEGEWVRAKDTTLGADNGMGVAAAMAVLVADNIAHGPLEVLLTINEEAGMDGAFGLDEKALKSKILLNLDSEDEGELFIGCAGGIDANVFWEHAFEEISGKMLQIDLKGLKGGHSGIDIHLGRANANKVLSRLALILHREVQARIHSYSGGNMRNAIPREAQMICIIPDTELPRVKEIFDDFRNEMQENFTSTDPGLHLTLTEQEKKTASVLKSEDQQAIFNALNACPDGVINMSKDIPGVVQTSTNLAIVKLGDGKGEAKLLIRSSNDMEKESLAQQVKGLFELSGASAEFGGAYPGWQPNNDSPFLAKAIETYEQLFQKQPKVKVIHAGLECGIIGGKYPGMDMLSFGPTIRFPHSPDEKVHIESVEKFWRFLKKLMQNI